MEIAGTEPDIDENLCSCSEPSDLYVKVVTVVVFVASLSYLVFILTKACYYLKTTLRSGSRSDSKSKETFLVCLSLF